MRVEHFEYGRIVVDGREERRDLILLPSGLRPNWWRAEGHALALEDLEGVLEERPDVLVVGTGTAGNMRPRPGLERELAARGVRVEVMPTPDAVRRVNELVAEGARVAAALHLTC